MKSCGAFKYDVTGVVHREDRHVALVNVAWVHDILAAEVGRRLYPQAGGTGRGAVVSEAEDHILRGRVAEVSLERQAGGGDPGRVEHDDFPAVGQGARGLADRCDLPGGVTVDGRVKIDNLGDAQGSKAVDLGLRERGHGELAARVAARDLVEEPAPVVNERIISVREADILGVRTLKLAGQFGNRRRALREVRACKRVADDRDNQTADGGEDHEHHEEFDERNAPSRPQAQRAMFRFFVHFDVILQV